MRPELRAQVLQMAEDFKAGLLDHDDAEAHFRALWHEVQDARNLFLVHATERRQTTLKISVTRPATRDEIIEYAWG